MENHMVKLIYQLNTKKEKEILMLARMEVMEYSTARSMNLGSLIQLDLVVNLKFMRKGN